MEENKKAVRCQFCGALIGYASRKTDDAICTRCRDNERLSRHFCAPGSAGALPTVRSKAPREWRLSDGQRHPVEKVAGVFVWSQKDGSYLVQICDPSVSEKKQVKNTKKSVKSDKKNPAKSVKKSFFEITE